MSGRVLADNAGSRTTAYRPPFGVGQIAEMAQSVFGRKREQNLPVRLKECLQAIPIITDDRHGTGTGLEQAHAWRISRRRHLLAGYVECEPLGGVKAPVQLGFEVNGPRNVFRPTDVFRIDWAGYGEAPGRPAAGGFEQQTFQHGLAVRAIRAQIAEVPQVLALLGIVELR